MLCQSNTLVKNERYTTTFSPLYCKCWHCDECRPQRTSRLVYEAKLGNPNLFITLTITNPGHGSPDAAAIRLAHAWRKVRATFLREHGKSSLAFLAVFEKTKKGWPHLHIVARCKWLDQAWLAERMDAEIASPVCWVERIHGKSKVAAYVTKYISKNPERFIGSKRYWRSIDYLKPPDAPAPEAPEPYFYWEIIDCHWRQIAQLYEKQFGNVEWSRNHAVWTREVPP